MTVRSIFQHVNIHFFLITFAKSFFEEPIEDLNFEFGKSASNTPPKLPCKGRNASQ